MVTEHIDKIKTDPDWRMWTTLATVVVAMMAYVSWANANMIEHIDLRMLPIVQMVEENTESRKKGGRYTAENAKEDKVINRINHDRLQKQIDHLGDMLNGVSRFHDEGAKLEARVLRLEQKIYEQ